MGYTDAQGRPEWIAQPFIKKGSAAARVLDTSGVVDDPGTAPGPANDAVEATEVGGDDPPPA